MRKIRVAITTGDIDGIGLEVTLKALDILGPQKNIQFIIFRSDKIDSKVFKKIDKSFTRIVVDSTQEALKIQGPYLVDIESSEEPAQWVETCADLCLKGKLDALVTGPISKTGIQRSGLKDIGHTDILKRVSGAKYVSMGFIGEHFNVVLATSHVPLKKVSGTLTMETITSALWNANKLRKLLPKNQSKLPIGVLGLNPHAGEEGLLGDEEAFLFQGLNHFASINKIPIKGPLVPDAAFLKKSWREYSVYLALYHDQGLIPFKMIHGQDSGVHMTLGIPFLRTSVDHGTAKDLFGKNKANPKSMVDAISWAVDLARL